MSEFASDPSLMSQWTEERLLAEATIAMDRNDVRLIGLLAFEMAWRQELTQKTPQELNNGGEP